MEKYNIEDQLAHKLGKRSIEPSSGAWERISFGKARPSKKKPLAKWFSIAAVFALLIGAGLYISSNDSTNTKRVPEPKVVFVEKPAEIPGEPVAIPPTFPQNQSKHPKRSIADNPSPVTQNIALPTRETITPAAVQPAADLQKDALIIRKSEEIAAELQRRIDVHLPVTDAVVDSLLQTAQREIAFERMKNKETATDANALLKETDAEINETFRQDAIRLFKNRFRTIRIALH